MPKRKKKSIRALRPNWGGATYELTDDEKDKKPHPLFGDSSERLVLDPSPNQRVPKGGAWAMIVRQLPPLEKGVNKHFRVARVFYVEHESNADTFGFRPDGSYKVMCKSPWGQVHLWPYEYSVLAVDQLLLMWQDKELTFHPTNVGKAQFNDVVFYARSRGIELADAMVMALGSLKGPVGWFEPRKDIAAAAEHMEERVHRWPPLVSRRKRKRKKVK